MVTMTNLHIEGEDFFFDGDLRLLGKTKIEDGSFTVTGTLILAQSKDYNDEIIAPTFEIIYCFFYKFFIIYIVCFF